MATLITQVSTQKASYASTFIYTMNVSFNGIEGDIQSAKIKVLMPQTIKYTLGDIQKPVKQVLQDPVVGGTLLTFDFGTIIDLGISARLSLGCQFKQTANVGDIFQCEPQLWINEVLYTTSVVGVVTLQVIPQFQISTAMILPTVSPAPGGTVVCTIDLENFGDKWAEITNVVITCPAPNGLTLDDTFTVVGKDKSGAPFQDTRADGIQGIIENNILTFNLPDYRGYDYQIIYRAIIDDTVPIGSQITTNIPWTINTVDQIPGWNMIRLVAPIYHGTVSKYGPDYTLPGEYINYEIYMINDGNQVLTNTQMTNELPDEVVCYRFQTGSFYIAAINRYISGAYSIDYTTLNGASGILGPFNSDINTVVDLTTIIPQGDQLSSLNWNIAALAIGMTQKVPPSIDGVVKGETPIGTRMLNHLQLEWDTPTGRVADRTNQTVNIANLCILWPKITEISPNTPVKPGEMITYQFEVDCSKSRLENPLIAAFIPPNLEFVGADNLMYTDYFPNPPTLPTPSIVVLPNFKNSGNTLVKAAFSRENSFVCRQRSSIKFNVYLRVAIGARGTAAMSILLNNTTNTGVISAGIDIYKDIDNLSENGVRNELYARSNIISNAILFFASIASNKMVKGSLDRLYSEEPMVGRTIEGGLIEYLLSITNVGNADLKSVEVIDILPHIYDTGVIETQVNRLSEYVVYNMNKVSAMITPLIPGQPQPTLTVAYSQSYNPVRFGNAFQTIGVDNDWSNTIPPIATDLRSFKVSTKNTTLAPNQTLTIKVQGVAPVGVVPDKIAWNSFAAKVSYIDLSGNTQYLLAVEPEKVGVQIIDLPPGIGKIGGIVFIDKNENGVYDAGDVGVNDIGVMLYDERGKPLKAIFTAPDVNGNPGYYLFNNLQIGKYYIRFLIDEPEYKFTVQKLAVEGGSKPYPATGTTPLIDLNVQNIQIGINAGMIKNTKNDRMDIALEINNSARKTLRSVIYNQMLLGMKLEDVNKLIEIE